MTIIQKIGKKILFCIRATFHNDVVLDIVGYRRQGHNEMDEPMITQPLMYKRIKAHPSILSIYSNKLLKEGVITEAFAKEVRKNLIISSLSNLRLRYTHNFPSWIGNGEVHKSLRGRVQKSADHQLDADERLARCTMDRILLESESETNDTAYRYRFDNHQDDMQCYIYSTKRYRVSCSS